MANEIVETGDERRARLKAAAVAAEAKSAAAAKKAVADAEAKRVAEAEKVRKANEEASKKMDVTRGELNNLAAYVRKLSDRMVQHWGNSGQCNLRLIGVMGVIAACFVVASIVSATLSEVAGDKTNLKTFAVRANGDVVSEGGGTFAGTVSAATIVGSATNIAAGTALQAVNGAAVTNLTGGNISSGNIPIAAMSNVLRGVTCPVVVTNFTSHGTAILFTHIPSSTNGLAPGSLFITVGAGGTNAIGIMP